MASTREEWKNILEDKTKLYMTYMTYYQEMGYNWTFALQRETMKLFFNIVLVIIVLLLTEADEVEKGI